MPDAPDDLRSALADRYAIERELGQGGMATVSLAEDLEPRRTVAIRILRGGRYGWGLRCGGGGAVTLAAAAAADARTCQWRRTNASR